MRSTERTLLLVASLAAISTLIACDAHEPTAEAEQPARGSAADPRSQRGGAGPVAQAQTPAQNRPVQRPAGGKPNILVIMGDDVGWSNISAYHQGIMSGRTPNLDRLAAEGLRFTDYYAEASCTAGRANFITGQIPLRTGLTTVGQAGADVGMPD